MQLVDGIELDYSGLPESHRETARLYMEHGMPPGSGWTAILIKDLRAVVMVDADTFQQLPQIYRWLVNHTPSQAWGSAENVEQWQRARKAERNKHVADPLRDVLNAISPAVCPTCEQVKREGGFGPSHEGSKNCESGSLASGGKNSHCTCDVCF